MKIDGHIVLICTGCTSGITRPTKSSGRIVASPPRPRIGSPTARACTASKARPPIAPNSKLFPNHRVCRDRGITHYEWLCNLEELLGKGEFYFQGLPLKIDKGSGSPVRAIAMLG